MNSDIRLSVSFLHHRKRKKLQKALGAEGVLAFIDLLLSAATSRPGGELKGMDAEDIALDAQWDGDPQSFVKTLCEIGLLDRCEEGVYSIHDWHDHNEYASHAQERKERAKKAARARWAKHQEENGNAKECSRQCSSNAQAMQPAENGNAPSPSPSPSPEEKNKPSDVIFEWKMKGQTKRLLRKDLDTWQKNYRCIDVQAEFASMIPWMESEECKWPPGKWFQSMAGALNKRNRAAIQAGADPDDPTGDKEAERMKQETLERIKKIEQMSSDIGRC